MPNTTMAAPADSMDVRRALDDVLARSPARDRATVEKHLAVCDAERDPGHALLWRRVAGTLAALAPLPLRMAGPHAVMFYVSDGKYRMQVFALEDRGDGVISLFLPDVMAQALKQKLITKSGAHYMTVGTRGRGGEDLIIETLDASNTTDPQPHFKHMIGWNRRALRLVLPTRSPDGAAVEVAESLCALAAQKWVTAAL